MTLHKHHSFVARLSYAWLGVKFALRTEHSLRFQTAIFVLASVALVLLRPGALWWAIVMLASSGVFAAELFNTAIEQLCDHLHPDIHPRIRIVKDCAAAAVLVTVLGALAVGLALLISLITRT
jgi:undecaprenol kinase